MLNIRKKKLKPYYVSQLTKFIEEFVGEHESEPRRRFALKRVIENFEMRANGYYFLSECSDAVFFSENPEDETLTQCLSTTLQIGRDEYTFIATFDDFYDVESSQDKE